MTLIKSMPTVLIKPKYQVTIPSSLRKTINLHEGDTLGVKIEQGSIVLTPKITAKRRSSKKSLLSMIGANKNSELYESSKKADQLISKQRNEWK